MQKVNTTFGGYIISFVHDGMYHTVTLATGYRGFNIPVTLTRNGPNEVWSVTVNGCSVRVLHCTEAKIQS